ncbi:VP5 [Lishui pangolin virus]|nr:VP5 [Lishui pangolin virus]
MSSQAAIFLMNVSDEDKWRVQRWNEDTQTWDVADVTMLCFSSSTKMTVNQSVCSQSPSCQLGLDVVRGGVSGVATDVIRCVGESGDVDVMKNALLAMNDAFPRKVDEGLGELWAKIQHSQEGFFGELAKLHETVVGVGDSVYALGSEMEKGFAEMQAQLGAVISRLDGMEVNEMVGPKDDDCTNAVPVPESAEAPGHDGPPASDDVALREAERHVRTVQRPRSDGRGMQVVDPERRRAVVTPNYQKTGERMSLQEYHSYGSDDEPHLVPMGLMSEVSEAESFVIPMCDQLQRECMLWARADMVENPPSLGENVERLWLQHHHVSGNNCAARHSFQVGDGSLIECVYLVRAFEGDETYTLEVSGYRDGKRNPCLIARALPKLSAALGFHVSSTKFCLAASPDFNTAELPGDVSLAKDDTLCIPEMSVIKMVTAMEEALLFAPIHQQDAEFENVECNVVGLSVDGLLAALTAVGDSTQFSMTPQKGSMVPTTLARMLRDLGQPKWAGILERMAKLFATNTAKFGNGIKQTFDAIAAWDDEGRSAARYLLYWKMRAVNFGPRISFRAVGVRNGNRLSFRGIPKAVMALNGCGKFGSGYVCPECNSVYRTVGERRMCTTMDLIVHKVAAVEGGLMVLTTLNVHRDRHPPPQLKITKMGASQVGWPKKVLSQSSVCTVFPYVRQLDARIRY